MLLGSSDINDSRVKRIGISLQSVYEVVLFSRTAQAGNQTLLVDGMDVKRFGTRFASSTNWFVKIARFVLLCVQFCIEGWRLKPDFIHAHDLNMLPIGYVLARLTGARLVYDSHELWAEQENKRNVPPIILKRVKRIEKCLAKRADVIITVSSSIARKLEKDFDRKKVWVVCNMPLRTDATLPGKQSSPLRRHPLINPSSFLLLYQGAVTAGRGCELMVAALQYLPVDVHVVYLGEGSMVRGLVDLAEQKGVEGRVVFLPSVANTELLNWTSGADIGVHPMRGTCLNHKLALPNKLFEYVQANVPVIVSDMPEMSAFVRQNALGEVFVDGDARDLANKVNKLYEDRGLLARIAQSCELSSKRYSWDVESRVLMDAYKSMEIKS